MTSHHFQHLSYASSPRFPVSNFPISRALMTRNSFHSSFIQTWKVLSVSINKNPSNSGWVSFCHSVAWSIPNALVTGSGIRKEIARTARKRTSGTSTFIQVILQLSRLWATKRHPTFKVRQDAGWIARASSHSTGWFEQCFGPQPGLCKQQENIVT